MTLQAPPASPVPVAPVALIDGMPDFDQRILPGLTSIACFRMATKSELALSYAAYVGGDFAELIAVWKRVADPTRATLRGLPALVYRQARLLPKPLLRLTFLATVRAVLAAGRHLFDRQLRPETAQAIRAEFSFLERRHEHIPPGYTPPLLFPAAFVRFIDGGSVAEAKARFQLVAAQNEVQQHAYSLHLAELFGLPELRLHAERERVMAMVYCRFAPPATEQLWRQSMLALDALNAAVFEMALYTERFAFPARSLMAALGANEEWARFVRGMESPLVIDVASDPVAYHPIV